MLSNFITPDFFYLHRNSDLLLQSLFDEYLISLSFDSDFIASASYDGYLPMGDKIENIDILLLKLHHKRTVLYPDKLHVGRTVRKKSSNYELTFDLCFDKVINAVWKQHGIFWFTPKLYAGIKPLIQSYDREVSFHSIELWENNELAAGDIGLISGGRYLSMTGFHGKSGAGTVLLSCIGKLLKKYSFSMWDLGMSMEYKKELGAEELNREDFVNSVREIREDKILIDLKRINAKELLTLP